MTGAWSSQRRYYERAGIDAWRTGTVPHHVTSNVAMAAAYADIVRGFVRDTRHRGPITILELGAGSGHFAFLFLRACAARRLRVRYVMTDVAAPNVAFWRRHEALAPFVRAGTLDVARFDAERDTIAPDTPAERLVVIASYVFSGLRHEARGASRLRPVGALASLDRVAALARDDLLVLVADRPATGALGRTLGLSRHGAASLPVDFGALDAWAHARGGATLFRSRAHRHIYLSGFVTTRRAWRATRAAGRRAVGPGGPDRLYAERRRLATARPTLPRLLRLIDRAGADPRVIAECVRPLWPHLARPSARTRRALRDAVAAAWPNYYHLGEDTDLAFVLALLLYEIRAYGEARRLFDESLRLYGEDGAARWNLGLCHLALGDAAGARAAFRRARALAPGLPLAGPALAKSSRGSRPSSAGRDSAGPRRRRPAPRPRSSSRRRR